MNYRLRTIDYQPTMDTGRRNIIILLAVIFIAVLIYFAWMFRPDGRHDWNELYHHNDEKPQPYSNEVILKLLEGYFPENELSIIEKKRIAEALPIDSTGDAAPVNYVFIGNRMYLDSADRHTLLDFAERGNQVFISAKQIPTVLQMELYKRDCDTIPEEEEEEEISYYQVDEDGFFYKDTTDEAYIDEEYYDEEYNDAYDEEYVEEIDIDEESIQEIIRNATDETSTYSDTYDTIATMNFTHPKLMRDSAYLYQYVYRNKPEAYYWSYYATNARLCDGTYNYIQLGYIEPDYPNFVKIPYGEGSFYFHSNPIVFTNYHLLDEDAVDYASHVFSHLPEGDIYWDEKSKDFRFNFPNRPRFSKSPLSYILSQQSLRWAWYLMLSLVALYILFRAKRKQRIIPIRTPNTNTSLEFIQTIGRLYHQQQDHRNLAEKMMYLFKDFVRRRYGIRLKEGNEKNLKALNIKSEVTVKNIDEIFTRYRRIYREDEISESHLTNFYRALEQFYKNCK